MFEWLSNLSSRPRLTLLAGILLAALCLVVAHARLRFTTDRTQLLDPRNQVQQDWSRFKKEFGKTNDYVVLLRGSNPEMTRRATDLLGESLQKSPHFQEVFFRLDMPEVAAHGLYFLSQKDLRGLLRCMEGARPWLGLLAHSPEVSGLLRQLALKGNPIQLTRELEPILPVLVSSLECLADSLESGGRSNFRSPLGPYEADAPLLKGRQLEPGQTRFYNQLADGHTFMVVALPKDLENSFLGDIATLEALQQIISQVSRSYPEVILMVTGEPAINTEEMVEARNDAIRCAVAALVTTSLLLIFAFGQLQRPLCAVISLLLGVAWSMGFAAIAVAQLNLLTVHFVTILTGLGITFSIQMLSEFQKLRAEGRFAFQAIKESLSEARHQAVGAITTAIAFFSLQFTSFRAAAELGWITGVGVLLCYLATLTMLPSLLLLMEGDRPCKGHPPYGRWLAPVELFMRKKSGWVLLAGLLWSAWCCTFLGKIPFDSNLLHLQGENAQAIRVEAYLQRIGYSTLYAVSLAPSAEEARRRIRLLEKLPGVSRVESVLALEPNQVDSKRSLIESLVKLAPQLPDLPKPGPVGARQLLETEAAYRTLKQPLADAVARLQNHPDGPRLRQVIQRLERLLKPGNPGPLAAGLMEFQKDCLADLSQQMATLKAQQLDPPDVLALVPNEVRLRSISDAGTICLRVFPKEDCWEREPLGRFVADLTAIDPHVTGTPILIYHYLQELRSAYTVSGRNALVVITLLLLGYYGSLRHATLALLPKLLGVVWMLGAMGMLGSSFNAANFLALPLTLGIGLIFGIESLRMGRLAGRPLMSRQSAGFAVALSGLTTLLGFSMLMNAEHRGVASFGLVMSLGVGMNMLTSLVLLPCLLETFDRRLYARRPD